MVHGKYVGKDEKIKMMYEYNGTFYTEDDLNKACRLYNAFQSGELQPVNDVNMEIAQMIMNGKQSQAVTLFVAANNVKRSIARKFLEENGERICANYFNRTVS